MNETALIDAIVLLSSIALISTIIIACLAAVSLIYILRHFEATRAVGATTAKLAEKELDLQRQIHDDRTETARQQRELLAQMRGATTDEIIG